jgi:Zn-dependent protease
VTLGSESPLERLRRIEAEAAAPAKPRGRGVFATVTTTLLVILAKGKALLGALKLGALLQTFSTLALSAAIYARYYGAKLAVGLVLLILVHEYGHGIAARVMGLRVGAPIFVPFFGAVIALKEQPRSTWVDAVVGFGGPLAGMAGGAVVLVVGQSLGSSPWGGLLVALAWSTFQLNLFNLTPALGLDGDRVTQPMRASSWFVGLPLLLLLGVLTAHVLGHIQPFLLIALLCGGIKAVRVVRSERRARTGADLSLLEQVTRRERYVDEASVEPWQRRAAAIAYFGLVTLLVVLLLVSQQLLPNVGR